MISAAQKAILHVAKSKLRLERDEYEAILQAEAGVTSSTDLDKTGFDRVMKRFEHLGFHNTSRKRRPRPQEPITPFQQQLIRELYRELGWIEIERQTGFSKRQIAKPWPQTRRDANKVIEGLKAIAKRRENAPKTSAVPGTPDHT